MIHMEQRKATISISAAGGTAGKGAKTYKLTLPSAWVNELGLNALHREVTLSFNGESITVSKSLLPSDFAAQKRALGHDVRRFQFYDSSRLCSTIYADFTDEMLLAENHIDDITKTAFGNNKLPSWADFQAFLQERCVPPSRAGIREYLETIGVAEYSPLEIIQKTAGRMAEDSQWIEMESMP